MPNPASSAHALCSRWLRHASFCAVLALASPCAAESEPGSPIPFLTGVNLASATFGPHVKKGGPRGKHGREYTYPIEKYTHGYTSYDYFIDKGMNAFRLGFVWERLQPKLSDDLDPLEFLRLQDTVAALASRGAWVILDVHNYARYEEQLIGSKNVTIADFADLWARLAKAFADRPRVIFNLMNEPYGISARSWVRAANAAIEAIRTADARNLILVPGINYSSTRHWNDDGNAESLLDIQDPLDHVAFDAHIYLNSSATGLEPDCVSEMIGVERMQPFTDWLRAHAKIGFLGEFGAGPDPVCLEALRNMARHMQENTDIYLGWTYWAAGPWWPKDYFTSIEPRADGTDAPQLTALLEYVVPKSSRLIQK